MVVVAVMVCAALFVLVLVVLTALGERRRGGAWPLAVVAGLVFPLTWAVWYARDELPAGRTALPRGTAQRLPHQRRSSAP